MKVALKKEKEFTIAPVAAAYVPARARTVRYVGSVNRQNNERALAAIGKLLDRGAGVITLFITSPGGATGIAMSFYDSIRHLLKPQLVTIGSGEVDSSGMIIFLSGGTRYVTAHTTALLHCAGRLFGNQRYTTREMAAMLTEDRQKDEQYADVIAQNSHGQLDRDSVLALMDAQTVLTPEDFIRYGLADGILA